MNEKKQNIVVTKTLSIYYSIKPKITKEKIKRWIVSFVTVIFWAGLALIAIYLFLQWTASVVHYFPPYTKSQTVSDILRAVVEVDGILLGFVGIVFAQMFGSLMDQQNIVYDKLLDEPDRSSESAKAREEYLEVFEEKRNNLVFTMLFTFFLLVWSVFESLKQIADSSLSDPTTNIFTWGYIQTPMLLTIGGIAVLLLSVFAFSLKPPSLTKKETEQKEDESDPAAE
jgi:hypothetical protein